ncbi:hypothetical protein ACQ4PT_048718 [Festuca glaucescens]
MREEINVTWPAGKRAPVCSRSWPDWFVAVSRRGWSSAFPSTPALGSLGWAHNLMHPVGNIEMAASTTKHILLFPFPAQGHLAAFTSVAGLLHRAVPSVAVTLVSTARNVADLSDKAPPWLAFHSLPFSPSDHGLPAHAESTDALPIADMVTLFEAFEFLQPAFNGYVQASVAANGGDAATVVVVSDLFVAWTAGIMRRHGCSHTFFTSCSAFGTSVIRALYDPYDSPLPVTPTGHVPVPVRGFPDEAIILHKTQISRLLLQADGHDRWSAFYHRQIAHGLATDGVLVNTVEELEPTGLAILRSSLHHVPVWPVGPLIRAGRSKPADDNIINWLDSHPPASVLYVSFGSQNSITQAQMAVLATALEHTGRPFVWAIRAPVCYPGDVATGEWLPKGFEERARDENRGLVVRGWAPQLRILAHRATSAFLSHCGWNSVLESLAHGVPLLGWPLIADQFCNVARLEQEWGVCVEVARGNTEDAPPPEIVRVAEYMERVMETTAQAADMRRRVKDLGELMRDASAEDGGSSTKALGEFLKATRMR